MAQDCRYSRTRPIGSAACLSGYESADTTPQRRDIRVQSPCPQQRPEGPRSSLGERRRCNSGVAQNGNGARVPFSGIVATKTGETRDHTRLSERPAWSQDRWRRGLELSLSNPRPLCFSCLPLGGRGAFGRGEKLELIESKQTKPNETRNRCKQGVGFTDEGNEASCRVESGRNIKDTRA